MLRGASPTEVFSMQLGIWVVALSLIAASTLACEPGKSVVVVNETEEVIMIGWHGYRHVVEPGESAPRTITAWGGKGASFWVYDNRNQLLGELDFSREELEAMDYQVTITNAVFTLSE